MKCKEEARAWSFEVVHILSHFAPWWNSFILYNTFSQVHISKPEKVSDYDEDEIDASDEERNGNKSFHGDMDADEEDCQMYEHEMQIGVTPFLSGVLPAGRLRARTKPASCKASGLIQVSLMEMLFIYF